MQQSHSEVLAKFAAVLLQSNNGYHADIKSSWCWLFMCVLFLAVLSLVQFALSDSLFAGDELSAWKPKILQPDNEAYLPNFSYAGYHYSEKPLPEHKPTLFLTDFGAKPNDGEDDTAAFLKVIEISA